MMSQKESTCICREIDFTNAMIRQKYKNLGVKEEK